MLEPVIVPQSFPEPDAQGRQKSIEHNAMITVYLCLRHRVQAKEIRPHHYFDLWHQTEFWSPGPPKSQNSVPGHCRLITQDISALFDVPNSIPRWMILASTRMWKAFFPSNEWHSEACYPAIPGLCLRSDKYGRKLCSYHARHLSQVLVRPDLKGLRAGNDAWESKVLRCSLGSQAQPPYWDSVNISPNLSL